MGKGIKQKRFYVDSLTIAIKSKTIDLTFRLVEV